MVRLSILGFLQVRPMSGYEIDKQISESSNFFWQVKQSQIYAELREMEEDEYIQGKIVNQVNRPNKKIYSLTKKGEELLITLVNTYAKKKQQQPTRIPFLLTIFFGYLVDKENKEIFFNNLINDAISVKKRITIQKNMISELKHVSESEKCFWNKVIDFGMEYYSLVEKWSTEFAKELDVPSSNKNHNEKHKSKN